MTTLAAGSAPALPATRADSARDARLRELVDQHYDFVWRSLRRFGVPAADAQDAAQEVFVSLSRRLEDVERGRERGFLYRTAMNHAAHAHRTRLRRREVGDEAPEARVCPAPGPEEQLIGARARELCYRVLAGLELDLRAVFMLYELEQLTMAEIAELLELAPGTVASRLRRARSAFLERARELSGDDGGGP